MGRRMEFRSCIDLLMIWGLMSSADILGTIHRHSLPPKNKTKTSKKPQQQQTKKLTQKHSQNKQITTTTTKQKQNGKKCSSHWERRARRNRYSTSVVLGLWPTQKPVQYVRRVGSVAYYIETCYLVLELVHIETGTVRTSCWDCGPHRNRYSTYFVLGLWPTQKLVTSCWDCGPHRNWLPRVGTMAHTETGYLVLGLWPTQKLVTSCWDCGPLRNWLPRVGTVAHTETGYLVLGLWPTQKPVQYVPRAGTLTHTETGTVHTSCWAIPHRNRYSTYLVLGHPT